MPVHSGFFLFGPVREEATNSPSGLLDCSSDRGGGGAQPVRLLPWRRLAHERMVFAGAPVLVALFCVPCLVAAACSAILP